MNFVFLKFLHVAFAGEQATAADRLSRDRAPLYYLSAMVVLVVAIVYVMVTKPILL